MHACTMCLDKHFVNIVNSPGEPTGDHDKEKEEYAAAVKQEPTGMVAVKQEQTAAEAQPAQPESEKSLLEMLKQANKLHGIGYLGHLRSLTWIMRFNEQRVLACEDEAELDRCKMIWRHLSAALAELMKSYKEAVTGLDRRLKKHSQIV